MRWIAPGVDPASYRYVQVRSIGFYPSPEPSEQISNKTLDQLEAYAPQQITAAFGRRFKLIEPGAKPGPQTLI